MVAEPQPGREVWMAGRGEMGRCGWASKAEIHQEGHFCVELTPCKRAFVSFFDASQSDMQLKRGKGGQMCGCMGVTQKRGT